MPIRTPTSQDDALAWWRAAVAGGRPEVDEETPQCGTFFLRSARGGPRIPVRIYLDQEIDPDTGELTAPEVHMAEIRGTVMRAVAIWGRLRPIPRGEYDALVAYTAANPETMAATKVAADITKMRFLPPKRMK